MYACISVLMAADNLRKKHADLGAHFKDRFTNVCKWYMIKMTRAYEVIADCLAKDTLTINNKKLNCIMAISFFSTAFGKYIQLDEMTQMGQKWNAMSEIYR